MLINTIGEYDSPEAAEAALSATYNEVKTALNTLGLTIVPTFKDNYRSWQAGNGKWLGKYEAPEMTSKQFNMLHEFQMRVGEK